MLPRRFSAIIVAAATAGSVAVAAMPTGAAAAGSHHTHRGTQIRAYDSHILSHSNNARSSNHLQGYSMNTKLWKVAHAWAEHMARTGHLEHNPRLESKVSSKCPRWTAIGENVGVTYGKKADHLFRAYMRSPEHRANILDRHYRQVGIATVTVRRHHHLEQWDVMDFGNHC